LHKVPRKISLAVDKANQDKATLKDQIRPPGPDSMIEQPEHEAGTLTARQYQSVNIMTSRRKY